jgi:hypothetical protein
MEQLVETIVAPTLRAAAALLQAPGIAGRCLCKVSLQRLSSVIALQGRPPGATEPDEVCSSGDLTVPLEQHSDDVEALAHRVAYAYGRGIGLRYWDPPAGPHTT